jgi:hypothetical protein
MESSGYEGIWKTYRRSNWAAGLWLVLGFPLTVLLSILLKSTFGETALILFVVLVVAWAVAWGILCLRVTRFRCPRCKGLYFAHTQLYLGAGKSCAHCGLRLYSNE